MKKFADFHNDTFHDGVSVFLNDDTNSISGTIKLDGRKTAVDLFCEKSVGRKTTEEGWFDLVLFKDHKVAGNDKILLHDALQSGGGHYHRRISRWRHILYPNLIVYSAECLTEDHKLTEITFSLDRLYYFFWYQDIESHFLYEFGEKNTQDLLDMVRDFDREKSKELGYESSRENYDFSDPHHVYFAHHRPDCLTFKIKDISYKVWAGSSGGFGQQKVELLTQNFLAIKFPTPQTIDDALDFVNAWSRLFNQIAHERLDLKCVSATASDDPADGQAEFYMPNYIEEDEKPSSRFHPSNVPFKMWSEKEQLLDFMIKWLEKNDERNEFRAMVNSTLDARRRINDILQIGTLCAAIDSLREFKTNSKIPKSKIKEVAAVAYTEVQKLGLPIEKGRITGLLGNLNNLTLKDKLRQMLLLVVPDAKIDDISAFLKQVHRLRQVAAHGVESERLVQPIAYPVCESLKALCVLYDLITCGSEIVGFKQDALVAQERFRYSFSDIARIVKNTASDSG